MPPRAPAPNREAVEALLEPHELRTIREAARLLGFPAERWPHVPMLARVFETLAAARRVEELTGDGLAGDVAMLRAALELEASEKTIAARIRRCAADARSPGT